jgi:hypothetical protein
VLGYRRLGHRRIEIEATAAGSIGLLLGLAACIAIVLLVRAAARPALPWSPPSVSLRAADARPSILPESAAVSSLGRAPSSSEIARNRLQWQGRMGFSELAPGLRAFPQQRNLILASAWAVLCNPCPAW